MPYNGFSIRCGCRCHCGMPLQLEGYSDADGSHYCRFCKDYVGRTFECAEQTREKVKKRELRIKTAGAL